MNTFIILAFLFSFGALVGWVIELFFRRFLSKANPERKWINPGFCVGPYIPLYGFGLCLLYLLSSCEQYLPIENSMLRKVLLIVVMMIALTLIEYLAGLICLKAFKVRLWNYSKVKFNIDGLICPLFFSDMGSCKRHLFVIYTFLHTKLAKLAFRKSCVYLCNRLLLRNIYSRRNLFYSLNFKDKRIRKRKRNNSKMGKIKVGYSG